MANLGASAARAHKGQPRRVRVRIRHGDDFHHVAIFQFGTQRHLLAIDLARHGVIAHIRVHGIGKIDHRCATWQRHDLALGREYVNGIGEQVHPHVVPELGRIACFVLDVEQRLQPLGAHALHRRSACAAHFLVQPMRRHTGLGHHVHFLGADLELDVHPGRPHQRGVQRLVAVDLGNRDMVLELARHRLVHLVQHAQRGIAIRHRGHDHTEAVDIGHLGKAQVVLGHLLVDGEQGFLAPRQAHMHAKTVEGQIRLVLHLGDQIASTPTRSGNRLGQRRITPWMQMPEGQILQFAEGLVQPQTMCNRHIDFQRLGRDAVPLGARHVRERPHVVRAICQLDENDAHVPRHGQQHLAKRLGLVFLAGVELQLVQLGQAVHHLGHGCTKALDQIGLGDATIFHRVMQQSRAQGLRIELPARTQGRHGNRMRDVWLAAVAHLPQVRLIGEPVSLAHLLDACVIQVVQLLQQRCKARSGRIGCGNTCASGRHDRSAGVRWCGGCLLRHCVHAPNVACAKDYDYKALQDSRACTSARVFCNDAARSRHVCGVKAAWMRRYCSATNPY
ncbi:hypothetical protein SDC9_93787 [bioreactor metagenome]|uniref:Uncharacterized protein n=1 Tax=bioreactor metagenome TaxID=1076179 RepID=A0A645A1K4_9ZZZZ